MASKSPAPDAHDGIVTLTHHAVAFDRSEMLKRRSGRKGMQPECLAIGHSWTEDAAREGGTICLVCHVVRWP